MGMIAKIAEPAVVATRFSPWKPIQSGEPRIREEGVRCDDFLGEEGKVAYRLFPLFRKEACVFLKEDQLCRIYDTRPDACRTFEPGGEQCREARRREGK